MPHPHRWVLSSEKILLLTDLDITAKKPNSVFIMLAVDIETMGLDRYDPCCPITMVCLYDGESGICKSYPFVRCLNTETGEITDHEAFYSMADDLISMLNASEMICCYNGVEFDLPFIAAKFWVSDVVLTQWILKTLDVFFTVKNAIKRFYKLDRLLQYNGFACKTGTGVQAIEYAKKGDVESLQAYCLQDAKLTWELTRKDRVLIPHQVRGKQLVWAKNMFFLQSLKVQKN
jgi:hypothetical protein